MTPSTTDPTSAFALDTLREHDAGSLRQAGRELAPPFRLTLADGRQLRFLRMLRLLPGRRATGEAELDGRRVLAKLFFSADASRRAAREHAGIRALLGARIPTPALIFAGPLAGGGQLIATAFLESARPLAEVAVNALGDFPLPHAVSSAYPLFEGAVRLFGCLHQGGLTHDDPHLGNILLEGTRLFLIDPDTVGRAGGGPLAGQAACDNLACLIAQFPRIETPELERLLAAYRSCSSAGFSLAQLHEAVAAARRRRLADFLGKTTRECTQFSVRRSLRRFAASLRTQSDWLAPFLAAPDSWMPTDRLLKDGGTASVARIQRGAHNCVLKRYNIKNRRHAFSRALRPTRAMHSWRAAHMLRFLGIPTPAPLAIVEQRLGPLRAEAWLLTEYCPGIDLLHLFANRSDEEPAAAEGAAIRHLFHALHREGISHGDLKATNLLWDGTRLWLIDLDATRRHRSARSHARAWRRDRARLLRNWPATSVLYRWLDANLPPAGPAP